MHVLLQTMQSVSIEFLFQKLTNKPATEQYIAFLCWDGRYWLPFRADCIKAI